MASRVEKLIERLEKSLKIQKDKMPLPNTFAETTAYLDCIQVHLRNEATLLLLVACKTYGR